MLGMGIDCSPKCIHYQEENETHNHLFFHYKYQWLYVRPYLEISRICRLKDGRTWLLQLQGNKKGKIRYSPLFLISYVIVGQKEIEEDFTKFIATILRFKKYVGECFLLDYKGLKLN